MGQRVVMAGRAVMVVAAMVEEATAAVAAVLMEAGAVAVLVVEVAVEVALGEAGVVLPAGDVELKFGLQNIGVAVHACPSAL